MIYRIQFEHWIPFLIEHVFLFFANPENLPRLMPQATNTRIDGLRLVAPPRASNPVSGTRPQLAGTGSEIDTSFRVFPYLPFRIQWVARITEFEWNHHFADTQVKGPFRSWHHWHEMTGETRDGISGTVVRDRIECDVGFGVLGGIANRLFLASLITSIFRYRQRMVPQLLAS